MNNENFDECRCAIPLIGDKFPEMEVETTHGIINVPGDYNGSWLVLFSHPADFTPVCTTEFVAFNRKIKKFNEINTKLIGLSVDQVYSHMKWTEWIKENLKENIRFPVIADSMGEISSILGMIHPIKGPNTVRAVFIVDDKGFIRAIFYYPQEIGRNIDEIHRTVWALQVSDKNKMALPENWPNNELIGKDAIIPPPDNEHDAKARKRNEKCYDWWFCWKKLK